MAKETLKEYASSAGVALGVDRQAGVLKGVKLLGLESRNGRTYTEACVQKATPLYNNAPVFVDHGDGPRSYRDKIGYIEGAVAKPDGIYGDFRLNMKHSVAEQLLWDAEHSPGQVGFSHDAEAMTSKVDGKTRVDEIMRILSVDLVAKPATVKGLFEGEEITDPEQREFCEHGLSALTDLRSIVLTKDAVSEKKKRLREVLSQWRPELTEGEIGEKLAQDERTRQMRKINCTAEDMICEALYNDEAYSTLEAKKSRVLSVLADWEREITKLPAASGGKESIMDWKDITLDSLKENRKDLVEVLTGTDATTKLTKQLQEAQTALAAKEKEVLETKAREEANAKELAIAAELKEAKIPESLVTDLFKTQLRAADKDGRAALIKERQEIAKQVGGSDTIKTAPPFTADYKPAVNVQEAVAAWR